MKIAIIGGGAAGFFAAISAKTHHAAAQVILFEKSNKLLAKVRISGGGRCNVTTGCTGAKQLTEAYPRGGKALKKAFKVFHPKDTMAWFESRGVALKTEADGRVFPVSDSSQTIIDCLMKATQKLGIQIEISKGIQAIHPTTGDRLRLEFSDKNTSPQSFDKIIVATGGSPKRRGLEWLERLGHQIVEPIPSLFTFNMPSESVTKLMGVVADKALVSIQGTKLKAEGPVLVTHWGMSGPAILKLSSLGARILGEKNYEFKAQINWVNTPNQDAVIAALQEIAAEHPQKMLSSVKPFSLPQRLWLYLLERSEISTEKRWNELGKKARNKLTTSLSNDVYTVKGKTTFKEEFVTCGGISLDSIELKTMQSRACPNLYFAGEVMDIDGITGGFNFQAAWTTGFIAGKLE